MSGRVAEQASLIMWSLSIVTISDLADSEYNVSFLVINMIYLCLVGKMLCEYALIV